MDEPLVHVVDDNHRRHSQREPARARVGHHYRGEREHYAAAEHKAQRRVLTVHRKGDAKRREEHEELGVVVGVVQRGVDAPGDAGVQVEVRVRRADLDAHEPLRDGVERREHDRGVYPAHEQNEPPLVRGVRHYDKGEQEGCDEEEQYPEAVAERAGEDQTAHAGHEEEQEGETQRLGIDLLPGTRRGHEEPQPEEPHRREHGVGVRPHRVRRYEHDKDEAAEDDVKAQQPRARHEPDYEACRRRRA